VTELVDFTEVLDWDLEQMNMVWTEASLVISTDKKSLVCLTTCL